MVRAVLVILTVAVAAAQPAGSSNHSLQYPEAGARAPLLLSKTAPRYTEEARRKRVQGTVVLYTQIGTDGRAHKLKVVHGLGSGLDENAMEAVRKWRFAPGLKNGQPAPVDATVEVVFRLHDEPPPARV